MKLMQLKIIISFISFFISTFLYFISKTFLYNSINKSNDNFQSKIKIKGLNFLKKLKNNKLKKSILFPLINNPKISIIIPVYNSQFTIELAVKSIQNQNFNNLEIILVNDFSTDNSSIIIKNIQNNDKRIKIINNNKNMGILYSRCIGVLNSKGKYIFALDNDDLFLDYNILTIIYKIANIYKYDITEFKSFIIPNYNPKIKDIKEDYFNHHKNNLILHQPELGIFPISKNNKYYANNFHIWGKCILSKIYKKAINLLGSKIYSIYNCWTEDISVLFIIFNLAKDYIFLNIYGIFHLISRKTTTFNLPKEHIIFSNIYLLDILIDFLKENEENKKYAVYKALNMNINISKLNEKTKIYLKSVLQKIINCRFISDENKLKILNKFQKLYF